MVKRKSIIFGLILTLIMLPCAILLSACGDKNAKVTGYSVYIGNNEYSTTNNTINMAYGDIIDFDSEFVVKVNFDNNTQKVVTKKTAETDGYTLSGEILSLESPNAGNYTITISYGEYEEVEVTIIVNKKQIDVGNTVFNYTDPYTYNGQLQGPQVIGLPAGAAVTVVGDALKEINVGNYTSNYSFVLANGYSDTNYEIINAPTFQPVLLNWSINKKNIDMADVTWNYTSPLSYNNAEQTVELTNLPTGISAVYTDNVKTAANTYNATATLVYDEANINLINISNNIFNIVEGDYVSILNWRIKPFQLSKPNVVGTYVFTGIEQTVSLTGFDNQTMEILNNSNKRTNAIQNATIEIKLKDSMNYEWIDGTSTNALILWTVNPRPVISPYNLRIIPNIDETEYELLWKNGTTKEVDVGQFDIQIDDGTILTSTTTSYTITTLGNVIKVRAVPIPEETNYCASHWASITLSETNYSAYTDLMLDLKNKDQLEIELIVDMVDPPIAETLFKQNLTDKTYFYGDNKNLDYYYEQNGFVVGLYEVENEPHEGIVENYSSNYELNPLGGIGYYSESIYHYFEWNNESKNITAFNYKQSYNVSNYITTPIMCYSESITDITHYTTWFTEIPENGSISYCGYIKISVKDGKIFYCELDYYSTGSENNTNLGDYINKYNIKHETNITLPEYEFEKCAVSVEDGTLVSGLEGILEPGKPDDPNAGSNIVQYDVVYGDTIVLTPTIPNGKVFTCWEVYDGTSNPCQIFIEQNLEYRIDGDNYLFVACFENIE